MSTSSASVSQNKNSGRVDALDGLRLLAILGVVVYHANASWLPGGFFGVTVFLALTGYLTTLSVLKKAQSKAGFDYGQVLLGRVKRLLPAALFVVGLTAALCALFATNLLSKVKSDALPAVFFVENIFYIVREVSYFAAAGLPSPLTHLWYLGVVMQLYIVWPAALLFIIRATNSRHKSTVATIALAAISAIAMAVLYNPQADTSRIYYGPDTRAAEFLVGAAFAIGTSGRGLAWQLKGHKVELPAFAYDVVAGLCLAGLLALSFTVDGYASFSYRGGFLLAAVLTGLCVSCVSNPGSLVGRVLGAKPLAEMGKRSFAAYLCHYPILIVFNPATRTTELAWWQWALEFLGIVVVSEFLYRAFEAPREKTDPAKKLQLGPVGIRLGVPLVADVVAAVAIVVLLVSPVSAETQNPAAVQVPEEMMEQVAETTVAPQNRTFDISQTYFAGTAFAQATDTINNTSHAIDVSTGATDASVIVIGDSVPKGAESQFYEYFPNGYMDAAIGRQLYTGVEVYQSCQAAGYDRDIVVWAIGDNGVAREDDVRALIDAVDPNKQIFICTVRVPLALQDINNELFKEIAAQYDNVSIIDWYEESAGHSEYFWDDGTHLRPEGAEAYVLMLRRAITGR